MAQQCRQQEDEAEDDQFLYSNDGDAFELRQREEMVEPRDEGGGDDDDQQKKRRRNDVETRSAAGTVMGVV